MAIDLNRIENLQIDEGTMESPFVLKDNEVTTLYRLALSNNRKIDIRGVVNTTTGTILKYEAYQIRKAWPNLTILAREVTTQDWTIQLLSGTITELESTTLLATNISIETLEWQINDVSLNVISGSYGEQDVRDHLHFDNTTGRIYYDKPTSNAGWVASVELAFYPSYIEEPEPEDFRTVILTIRAIAVTSVTITAPSRIDESATINITLAPYPATNTKGDGIRYSLQTTYGILSPSSGSITPRDTFVYYAPPFSAVPYDEDAGGKFYNHSFVAGFYMFGSTTSSGTAEATILMKNTEFQVTCDKDSLIEGERAEFTVDGYTWDELQKTMVVDELRLSGITEEELRNRVLFENGPFFSMIAPIDNATYSADVVLYIAPPGADPIGERAKVFNMHLSAIGLTSVTITPQTIGQNIQSIINIEYRPRVHTKGTLSYDFRCDAVNFIRRDDVNGIYTIFSSEISTEGHDATATIYSEYIGTGVPLIQSINKLYVQDIYFNVTFDGEEQRTISIDEGNTAQCYVDILHISELKKEINVAINSGSEWVDNNWITDRLHFSDDTTTDLIWFDYPQENLSWNATITIRFIAKYIPEGVEPPYSQTVVINVDARAVEGIEWQDSNNDNYQIAVTPYRSSKSFKIKTYPYNNTKQVVLESPTYMSENPFSHGALAAGIIMNEILPYGTFSTNATVYGDWLVYGYLDAFSSNPQFGTITTNTFGRTTQNGTPSTQNIVYPKFYTLYDRIANSKVELRKIDDTYVDNYTCLLGDEPVTPTFNKNVGKATLNSETSVTVIEDSDTLDSVSFYVQVGGKSNSVDFEKVICSHFAPSSTDISLDGNADTIINYNEDYKFIIRISYGAIGVEDISQETTQTLKEKIESYITSQYENDTPIVIYYPLETMQSSEYANTLYQDYVFYQTLPYHIYTANNPDNQCSVEFINNDNTAVNRKVFGITYPVDSDNNRAIETMLVNNIRINPSEVSQVPFFSGTPASINQYDSDGNLLLDTNGDPEKGEVNIWENFSGKYEEWTDDDFHQVTWDFYGNTVQDGIPTPDEPIYPTHRKYYDVNHNFVEFSGLTLKDVFYGDTYSYVARTVATNLGKYEFTGTENITVAASWIQSNASSFSYNASGKVNNRGYMGVMCSHLKFMGTTYKDPSSNTPNIIVDAGSSTSIYLSFANSVTGIVSGDTAATAVTKFKTYLANQYNAGTPVTIWYAKSSSSLVYDREYYSQGRKHYRYTISKLLKEDDSDGTTPNKFNPAFVYNKDGTIPTQFFLSRFTPAWNNDDNETTISMAKGLKAQQRTITKENVLSKGCYYKNNNGELQQISSLYYGPWMAYIWLAYITYGTNNLKNLIGVGASKISADAQIFADDSGTLLIPGQQYGALYIINNPLLNDATYTNYDFNIIGVKDIGDIAKEPISSYKIDSVSVGSVYTVVSLADDEGNPTTYTAVNANDFYSLNACFSKTGYSEENYKDIDGNVVISGYGENSTYYNDSRHPVRCLNVENMWGGGNYIVDGTGFATDVEDTTKVHPLLWDPQDNNQNLNDINTWDKLSDVDVLNQTGTWDIGSVKYYNSKCGWANSPAGANVPYKGFNVYGRLNNLDVDTRYNWSTGNYYDWSENSDLPSMCGLGQTSMLVDGSSIPIIKTNTDSYQLVEYIQNTSSQYIDTGFRLAKFVHDIQLTSTGSRKLMGHSASNPYWGQTSANKYELCGSPSQVAIGNRDIVTYTVLGSTSKLAINGVQVGSAGSGQAASNEYQIFALGGGYNTPGKLYGLKVYDSSDSLIGNMLPCYRISDNKPGLYDIVRQQFLTNAGSGEFTLGPVLQSAKDLDEDRYFKLDCLNIGSSSTNLKYYNANTRLTQNSKIVVEFVSNHSATMNSYFGGTKTLANKTSLNLYVSTDNRLCCENGTSTIYLSDIDTIMPGTKHTIEVECNATTLTAKLDGVQTYSGSSYELDTTLKYYLFTINNQESPTTSKFFNGSIYSFKIYKNNTLAREFLGVYNKKEETFGLYETISMKYHYYESVSTQPRIPRAYQEVEYIQTTGTQYIDTGLIGTANTSYLVTAQAASNTNMLLFGSRTDASLNNLMCASTASDCLVDFGDYQSTRLQVRVSTDKFTVYNSKNLRYINNTQSTATYSGSVTTPSTMRLLDVSGTPPVSNTKWKGKLFVCKVWENDVLLRDFVPCCRKADNEIGLYDIINNEFYTNQGTGDFEVGPYVNTSLNQALMPIDSIVFKSGQYIDTGWNYKPNSTIQVIAQKSTDSAKSLVFGNEVSNNALSMAISDASKHPYAMIGSTTQALTQNSATSKPYALTLTANASSFNYLVKGSGIASIVKSSDSVGVTAHSTSCFLGGSRGSDGTIVSNSTQNSIYECTIWEGNNIVKHFVPVFNLVSNEVGMYETVNEEFYGNAGTDALVAGNGNCIESEFIQNTDNANFTTWNFDTNVKFKDTGKIVVDLDVMQSSADGNNKCINGSLSTTAAGSTFLSYSTEIVGGVTLISRVKEGSKVSWVYTYDTNDNTTIHISGAGTTDTGKYNYKRVTIYANDGVTKLRDYVPVKVGVGGFYDTITGATIINQFTTTSTFGPEIDNTVPGDPGMYFEKLKLIVKVFGTL